MIEKFLGKAPSASIQFHLCLSFFAWMAESEIFNPLWAYCLQKSNLTFESLRFPFLQRRQKDKQTWNVINLARLVQIDETKTFFISHKFSPRLTWTAKRKGQFSKNLLEKISAQHEKCRRASICECIYDIKRSDSTPNKLFKPKKNVLLLYFLLFKHENVKCTVKFTFPLRAFLQFLIWLR